MIEGEYGPAIIEQVVVLKAAGLIDGDQITTAMLGSVMAQALRQGDSPRSVALALWDALPSDDDWEPVMRERWEQAIELAEESYER